MKTQTNRNGSITSTMTTTTTTILLNLKTDHHNCPLVSLSLFSLFSFVTKQSKSLWIVLLYFFVTVLGLLINCHAFLF